MSREPKELVAAIEDLEWVAAAKKKLKHTDEWLAEVAKDPMGSFGMTSWRGSDFRDDLIAAAKERGLNVTSVTPINDIIAKVKDYLAKKGVKTAAANKKFDQYILLAADNANSLRKSDVFRVLSQAKSAKELSALAAYIIDKNGDLRVTVTEDTKDVKDEKGWA